MTNGCVFCAVVAGAERHTVFRDENVVAFLDHAPVFHGHTLVVPARHYETLDDLPDEAIGPLFTVVRRVSVALQSALGAEGTFTGVNTRISQSVPHVHVHVVPRRKGDGYFSPRRTLWIRQKYDQGEAERIAAKLRAALEP